MGIAESAREGRTSTAGVSRQDVREPDQVPAQRDGLPGAQQDERGGEHRDEQGTGELVRQASQQVSELLRAELRLAAAELKDKGRHAGQGAAMFGGAGLVAMYGAGVLLAAVVAALALVLPVWASALIVGAVLMAAAGVLAMLGRAETKKAAPPKPEQALDEARETVADLKEKAHR
ncbi:phage holin family protein [Spirillospora albida]|uniref:phage holin family protein n=1 Tax=Spirillospora albida TaxID=58123 RepID=UPI0009FD4998|nr:phage holin family protein [Spirillospora albida]